MERTGNPPNEFQYKKLFNTRIISTVNYCQTREATHLCINDFLDKMKYSSKSNDGYNIGGTYSSSKPELWFYFTTSCFCDDNYLLNLFFCNRIQKSVSIKLSEYIDFSPFITNTIEPIITFSETRNSCTSQEYIFNPSKPDQHRYIRTYCFSYNIFEFQPGTSLLIPISISIDSYKCLVNTNILNFIKLKHSLEGLRKITDTTNFVLQSVTGQQFPVHKVVLLAHSTKLCDLVKDPKVTSLLIDIDDDAMELFIEFLYTGTIKNIMKQNCYKLLKPALKFKFDLLIALINHVIIPQMKATNAIEIAVIAKEFDRKVLQEKVFEFIGQNTEVFKTDAWLNLQDPELYKTLHALYK